MGLFDISIFACLARYRVRVEKSNKPLKERCIDLLHTPDSNLSNISIFASVIYLGDRTKLICYPELYSLPAKARKFVIWHELSHLIYNKVRDTSKASPIFIEVMCDLLAIKRLNYSFEEYKQWNLSLQEAYLTLINEANDYLIAEEGYRVGTSGIDELAKRLELVEDALKRKE